MPLQTTVAAPPTPPLAPRGDADDGSSALDRLQLLSTLLLALDPAATMDVSMVSHDEYAINGLTVRGRQIQGGFGCVTARTNVRNIVAAVGKAVESHGPS